MALPQNRGNVLAHDAQVFRRLVDLLVQVHDGGLKTLDLHRVSPLGFFGLTTDFGPQLFKVFRVEKIGLNLPDDAVQIPTMGYSSSGVYSGHPRFWPRARVPARYAREAGFCWTGGRPRGTEAGAAGPIGRGASGGPSKSCWVIRPQRVTGGPLPGKKEK